MKNILLKSLNLENFKGIKEKQIDFGYEVTNIFGTNGIGKTTIFDAFSCLLFNKNSEGKTFDVRTLDENNNVIERLTHSVEGIFLINGTEISFKKVLEEKWVKKKGAQYETFQGTTNSYFCNDVPLKEKEFNEKIEELVSEATFKLITSPTTFSNLNWARQREFLFEIAGNVSDKEVINGNERLKSLSDILTNKSMDEYKLEIAYKKKKYKKDLEEIAPRIDEVYKQKIEIEDAGISQAKDEIQKEISEINKKNTEISDNIT